MLEMLPDHYYQDDACTIYCGDCREIMPLLPKVDLVLTDPPYGIGFAAQPTKWQRLAGKQPESWDDLTFYELEKVLDKGRFQIVWGGNYYPLQPQRGWLCWQKPDAPPSMGSFELAWTNIDQNTRFISHSISATNAERIGHPTQKPLRVIQWSIQQAPPGIQTILDPFMGSGTTLRAAKDLGRKAIGIEINPAYCEIAKRRLAQEVFAL